MGTEGNDDTAGRWPPSPLRVPDDASELEPDRQVWLRETALAAAARSAARRRARRKALRDRLLGRWADGGLSGPVGVLVLVVIAAIGALAVLLGPTLAPSLRVTPLAATTVSAGEPGGLLPDSQLRTVRGDLWPARTVRPSVIALVPTTCDCGHLLDDVQIAARRFTIPIYVAAPDNSRGEVDTLAAANEINAFSVLEDVDDQLAQAYRDLATGPDEPVFLLVHADGVVRDARTLGAPDASVGSSPARVLEAELATLGRPGAA